MQDVISPGKPDAQGGKEEHIKKRSENRAGQQRQADLEQDTRSQRR